jgi:hypothetical protein
MTDVLFFGAIISGYLWQKVWMAEFSYRGEIGELQPNFKTSRIGSLVRK